MSQQRHTIKRQIIELTVRQAAEASKLQTEVGRVYRQRIVPLIERYCTELSDPDKIYRIDSLELDVGHIDPDRLESELIAKVASLLEPGLIKKIEAQEQQTKRQGQSLQSQSQLELLTVFVRTGSLPWWADASRPQLLDDCVRDLIRDVPDDLGHLMQRLVLESDSLGRLANHFDDELLAALAGVLVQPDDANLGTAINQLISAIKGMMKPSHRSAIWRQILQVSSYAAGTYSGKGEFYRMVLEVVAAESDISLQSLLLEMRKGLPAASSLGSSLTALADTTEVPTEAEALDRRLRNLQAGAHAPIALWRILLRLTPHLPTVVQQALLDALKDSAPEEYGEHIGQILQTALTMRQLPPPLVEAWVPDLAEAGVTLTLPSAEIVEAPPDLSFSDADELYVDNAGLVILWPFLTNFFGRLGLLAGNQFQNAAARQRAAGLLQVVATDQATFPEYFLPLNKVMCGLNPADLFEFGSPLTEVELAECEHLLQAAIVQAPILKEMSLTGFRGTFLLRSGVLRSRDGAWLLQVERETFDIVLDRFPWGWEWVRLPWMESPLRVEW